MSLGPLRLDEVREDEPAGVEQPYPVAERAVVLDVGHLPARVVDLDVGGAVPVGLAGGQPGLAGVVGEHPPGRVGDRERQPAAGPGHPGHLGDQGVGVGDELQRAEGGEDDVEGRVRERDRCRARADGRDRGLVLEVDPAAVLELAQGHVQADRAPAVAQHPARALTRAAAELEDVLAADLAERTDGVLALALGAPEKAVVTEELAVRGLVLVGVTVPVGAVGVERVLLVDRPAFGTDRSVGDGHGEMIAPGRLPGWTQVL